MSELKVHRVRDSAGIFRRVAIEVDGRIAGRVWQGNTLEVTVEPGQHSVRARMDWQMSPLLQVQVQDGQTVSLRVEYPFSAITKLLRGADSAIRLELA